MNTIKIYLAHALTNATPEFRSSMESLKDNIKKIPEVTVLEFAWAKGPEFNQEVNVYDYDMACVREADLMIAILDHISSGTAMEIQTRCGLLDRPLACFFSPGSHVSKIISDCIRSYRMKVDNLRFRNDEPKTTHLPDPIKFNSQREIVDYVSRWVKTYREKWKDGRRPIVFAFHDLSYCSAASE